MLCVSSSFIVIAHGTPLYDNVTFLFIHFLLLVSMIVASSFCLIQIICSESFSLLLPKDLPVPPLFFPIGVT